MTATPRIPLAEQRKLILRAIDKLEPTNWSEVATELGISHGSLRNRAPELTWGLVEPDEADRRRIRLTDAGRDAAWTVPAEAHIQGTGTFDSDPTIQLSSGERCWKRSPIEFDDGTPQAMELRLLTALHECGATTLRKAREWAFVEVRRAHLAAVGEPLPHGAFDPMRRDSPEERAMHRSAQRMLRLGAIREVERTTDGRVFELTEIGNAHRLKLRQQRDR